ncbi:Hypothetical predicted protein, partial [Cloeon dipterum]
LSWQRHPSSCLCLYLCLPATTTLPCLTPPLPATQSLAATLPALTCLPPTTMPLLLPFPTFHHRLPTTPAFLPTTCLPTSAYTCTTTAYMPATACLPSAAYHLPAHCSATPLPYLATTKHFTLCIIV